MKRLDHYSQNFLRSPRLIKELIGHSSISKKDLVYDIGAGSGVISSVLAERARAVVAIEFEPRIVATLRANMERYSNVKVYQGDFLKMPLPQDNYKIFANIPFHLSSPIVHKITEADNQPEEVYLVVQKQFANKLLPDSDHFTGQLGMMIGPDFAVRIRKRLQRTDFWPHPNVDTVLLEMVRREQSLIPKEKMPVYREFIKGCFSDPKIFAKTPRQAAGLMSDIRPSQMKLTEWVTLFNLWSIEQTGKK